MPVDPFVLGGIIAGGASLLGSAMSIGSGANLNKKNREWQEKMQAESWAREDAQYASRYSPAAQAQNMRAAGLNPMGQTSTMNVGTSSSVPTPATQPMDFSGVGDAGQAIASNLHAREAMKQQKAVLNQQITEQNRRFLLDVKQFGLNEAETKALVASRIAELEGLQIDNDTKNLNLKMLQDFIDAGGNTYSDSSAYQQAQTAYTEAQTEYQDLMKQISDEQRPHQIEILKQQAESLKANAIQAYHNAMLADAQAEVAKSSKIKIDAETEIANNQDARAQAMHVLEAYEQRLINQGISLDNARKAIDNVRNRILNGDVRTFGELGQFMYTHLHSLIPFASSPLKFD